MVGGGGFFGVDGVDMVALMVDGSNDRQFGKKFNFPPTCELNSSIQSIW